MRRIAGLLYVSLISTVTSTRQLSAQGPAACDSAAQHATRASHAVPAAQPDTPSVTSVDRRFAAEMLPHHVAAIDMARTELLGGTDPEMRRLAEEIIVDQQSEIDAMARWLRRTSASPPPVTRAP